jgi:hypothetical protein
MGSRAASSQDGVQWDGTINDPADNATDQPSDPLQTEPLKAPRIEVIGTLTSTFCFDGLSDFQFLQVTSPSRHRSTS